MSNKREEREVRPERKRKGGPKIGVHYAKMSVPEGVIPPDRVGRWINDRGTRIQLAMGDDWEFVPNTGSVRIGDGFDDKNSDVGDKISMIVGSGGDGGKPERAYLMMKYRDWYEADRDEKQKQNDAIEDAIKRPGYKAGEKGLDESGMYGKMKYKS